jgi:hypothetical protein
VTLTSFPFNMSVLSKLLVSNQSSIINQIIHTHTYTVHMYSYIQSASNMLIPIWEGLKLTSPQCHHKCASGLWKKLGSGFKRVWALAEHKFKLFEVPDLHFVP